jgi:ADP-ribosylation factor-like protein 2
LEFLGYHLNLWDIGGQSSIRAYWRNYFEQTDGIVWVIDSLDVSRLDLVREELQKVLQQERLVGASLLIWANKQDLQGSFSTEQIAEALHLSPLSRSDRGHGNDSTEGAGPVKENATETSAAWTHRHWSIHACSAVKGEGLLEGMDWLVKDIGDRIFLLS